MPKLDGSPTAGEVTAEQLRQTKAELHRLAQQLEQREQALSEKLAAASLAEELRAAREERRQEREREREQTGEKLPAHRPSEYTEEAAASLLRWITDGKSLRKWCEQSGISVMAVYRWMGQDATFRERYARAHDDRADTLADEILDISDEVAGTDSIAAVQAARLRVDARKWVAAKLKPQKWGDKQVVEQTGSVTFNLGIPLKPPSATVIDGKSLISQSNSPGLSDYESVSLQSEPPSLAFSSSGEPAGQRGDAPSSGPDATP